ncbi:MAG: class I SAM-dependent methyltransferase [Candidatus Omnitrophica bacterium]|nr:class I SAM-dependent methyltransferase [Candidatus Omnitrophota bacterium]
MTMKFPPKTFDYDEPPPNEMIIERVPRGSSVLDVGCSSGKLGQTLKQEKECKVVGVEGDHELARRAKNFLDDVYELDLNSGRMPNGSFDCIIFSDILEHMLDPASLLKSYRGLLKEGGRLLCSLPNVANWQIRLNLLAGIWDYEHPLTHWGHLHYFTLGQMRDMIEYSGYGIDSVAPRNLRIKLLGRLWPELFAFQFVIQARKK